MVFIVNLSQIYAAIYIFVFRFVSNIVHRIHRDKVTFRRLMKWNKFCVKYIRSPGPFISMCKQVILSFTTFINQNVDYILEIFFFGKR